MSGPDGELWFTNNGEAGASNNSGQIGTMGVEAHTTHLFSCSTGCTGDITNPHWIVVGPDGNLWFTSFQGGAHNTGSVGTITTAGVATVYNDISINGPEGIAVGPDGNLWFANTNGNSIDRITISISGGVKRVTFHAFTCTAPCTAGTINAPKTITAGADGALWFTNFGTTTNPGHTIGRITTAGVVTNFYSDPSVAAPTEIVPGTDGDLWFTNSEGKAIDRITTTGANRGKITPDPDPPGVRDTYGLAVGSDDALWFTSVTANVIGRIDLTSGTIKAYTCPCTGGQVRIPYGIGAGPDGNMWFADHDPAGAGAAIGVITTTDSVTFAPVEGPAGTPFRTLKGAGFQAGETVKVTYFVDSQTEMPLCTATAAPDGTFSCVAKVPSTAGTTGPHTIQAKGMTSGKKPKSIFELTAA